MSWKACLLFHFLWIQLVDITSSFSLQDARYSTFSFNNNKLKTTTSDNHVQRIKRMSVQLFNIPPPLESDVLATRTYANTERPPASFYELQRNSVRAVRLALRDGHSLLEIEFPPLPANVLELDDVSAYDVAQANLRLATEFAQSYVNSCNAMESSDDGTTSPPKVAILLPDEAELEIGLESTGLTTNPHPGVIISALRRRRTDSDTEEKSVSSSSTPSFWSWFGKTGRGSGIVRPIDGVTMYICIIASAQELPDIEELYQQLETTTTTNPTIICYNLKLDVLRGDLGAPAFPSKAFHDRFLSRMKPVYYLRTRQYSRSTSRPPFLVNYQGCLFRSYPGQYQTLLDTGTGSYRRVTGSDVRPSLGEFKEQLTQALREQGVLEEEGSTLNFLRTGYKTTTWWEEDRPEASDAWKT